MAYVDRGVLNSNFHMLLLRVLESIFPYVSITIKIFYPLTQLYIIFYASDQMARPSHPKMNTSVCSLKMGSHLIFPQKEGWKRPEGEGCEDHRGKESHP